MADEQKKYAPFSLRLLFFFAGLVGVVMYWLSGATEPLPLLFFLVQLFCLQMMLRESSIFITAYFRMIAICIALFIFGYWFKIKHFEGGDMLLLISLSGIALVYLVRFALRKNKNILDVAKVFWVWSQSGAMLFRFLHWEYADLLGYVSIGSFLLLFILFLAMPPDQRKEHVPYREKLLDQVD